MLSEIDKMYHNDFDFKFCKYSISTTVQRDTYAMYIQVIEILSIEHDYPNFFSDQIHMHEILDFEFIIRLEFSVVLSQKIFVKLHSHQTADRPPTNFCGFVVSGMIG